MADDLKYGYKGAEPTQSFGSNTGVFDPNDINNLIADNKWTTFGQLELIETQTISAVSSTNFTSIDESIYNVHFLTVSFTETTTDTLLQISNNGGASYHTAGYQYAVQYGSVGGTFAEDKSTSTNNLFSLGGGGTGLSKLCYTYLYNLGDSSKYSFSTTQFFGEHPTLVNYYKFGSGVYPTAETHNAIRLKASSTGNMTGTASLYGIRYS